MKFSSDRPKALIGLNYAFHFGKYKGEILKDVLEEDPNYIIWCSDSIDWFDLDTDVYDMASEKDANKEDAGYYYDTDDVGKWTRY